MQQRSEKRGSEIEAAKGQPVVARFFPHFDYRQVSNQSTYDSHKNRHELWPHIWLPFYSQPRQAKKIRLAWFSMNEWIVHQLNDIYVFKSYHYYSNSKQSQKPKTLSLSLSFSALSNTVLSTVGWKLSFPTFFSIINLKF